MRWEPFYILDKLVDRRLNKCNLQLNILQTEKFKIEYWSGNSKLPNLLLLHAFGAESKYSWIKQIKLLSKHFNLLIPNLIYFGNSDMEPRSFRISDQVDAMKVLLNELKIKTFLLGGASYGGVIACELALLEEFNIEKLFLTNTPVKYGLDSDWESVIQQFKVEKKADVLVPKSAEHLRQIYEISMKRKSYFPAIVFKNIHQKLYTKSANERRLLIDSFIEEQDVLRERTYAFPFPILMIWGKNDQLTPLRIGEQLQKYFGKNSRLEVIENTAHMPNFQNPAKYNSLLLPFLLNNEESQH